MRITGELGRTLCIQQDFTSNDHIVMKIIEGGDGVLDGRWVYLDKKQILKVVDTLQKLAAQL